MPDSKIGFFQQIRITADTVLVKVLVLRQQIEASSSSFLISAVHSVLFYGAKVWAEPLSKEVAIDVRLPYCLKTGYVGGLKSDTIKKRMIICRCMEEVSRKMILHEELGHMENNGQLF